MTPVLQQVSDALATTVETAMLGCEPIVHRSQQVLGVLALVMVLPLASEAQPNQKTWRVNRR